MSLLPTYCLLTAYLLPTDCLLTMYRTTSSSSPLSVPCSACTLMTDRRPSRRCSTPSSRRATPPPDSSATRPPWRRPQSEREPEGWPWVREGVRRGRARRRLLLLSVLEPQWRGSHRRMRLRVLANHVCLFFVAIPPNSLRPSRRSDPWLLSKPVLLILLHQPSFLPASPALVPPKQPSFLPRRHHGFNHAEAQAWSTTRSAARRRMLGVGRQSQHVHVVAAPCPRLWSRPGGRRHLLRRLQDRPFGAQQASALR